MKIKIIIVLVFTLVFLYQHSIAKAATSVNLFQITTEGSQQKDPLIYKNLVVYDSLSDIWGYNSNTKENFPILEKSGQQYLTGFYKNLIVYEDVDDATLTSDIRLYNMKNKKDILIAGGAGSQSDGVTNGKGVIYINGGACGTLNSYEIKTGITTQIFDLTCTPIRIFDDIVVFQSPDPNGTNIKGYNLNKKELFDITTEDNFQEVPNIYKDNVVWLHRLSGAYGDYNAIKMKNLHTGQEKTIYESSTDALQYPAISDKYVVWSQSSVQHVGGVMGANLKTGEVFEVQPQGPHQNSHTTPAIWKNTAVWMSFRTGNGDIYGATFHKE